MEDIDIVSVEKLIEDANKLLNKMASARRELILLRYYLQTTGRLSPDAIASLNQADEAFRGSMEKVRTLCALQVDTVTRFNALKPID